MENFVDKTDEHIKLAGEIIDELKLKHQGVSPNNIKIPFESYHVLKDYTKIKPLQSVIIEVGNKRVSVCFVHVEYSVSLRRDGSNTSTELREFVIVNLPSDFGHVFIKRESVADKLQELFQPLEIDVNDDKAFSRKFYVLSKDKSKAESLLNPQFRSLLKSTKLKGLQIEVLNQLLLLDFPNSGSLEDVIKFGLDLSEIQY
jgi:hypothetical protein